MFAAVAPRRFSTATKVYPSYLPHLRRAPRMPFKWLKPVAALVVVGFGIRTYTVAARERFQMSTSERYDDERQRNNNLMDEYGSRDSIEDLEKAIQFYEKK